MAETRGTDAVGGGVRMRQPLSLAEDVDEAATVTGYGSPEGPIEDVQAIILARLRTYQRRGDVAAVEALAWAHEELCQAAESWAGANLSGAKNNEVSRHATPSERASVDHQNMNTEDVNDG